MAEDWKAQLKSEDPKVRAQAVKILALSGDRANLVYLKGIAENDPDPRVQDYARKAAQHLFSATESAAAAPAPPPQARQPEPQALPPEPKTERRAPQKTISQPEPEPPRKHISQTDREAAESKVQRALSFHMKGQTPKGLKSLAQGLDLNPYLAGETFTKSVAAELTGLSPDLAIKTLQDPVKRQELINPKKNKAAQPASPEPLSGLETLAMLKAQAEPSTSPPEEDAGGEIPLVKAWLSFFQMTEEFFYRIVAQANTEDTLISILVYMIASMVAFLVTSFGQLQQVTVLLQQQLGAQMPDLRPIMLGILISMIFLTPLSFFFGAGIQYLGLRLFKGTGTFKEHAYVLALVTVPMTVVSLGVSLLSLVPVIQCIGGLVGMGLSIWSIIITVRGMKAVHSLSTGQAIAGLIIPPLALAIIGGCLLTLLGSTLMGWLGNMLGVPGGFPQ